MWLWYIKWTKRKWMTKWMRWTLVYAVNEMNFGILNEWGEGD